MYQPAANATPLPPPKKKAQQEVAPIPQPQPIQGAAHSGHAEYVQVECNILASSLCSPASIKFIPKCSLAQKAQELGEPIQAPQGTGAADL
jgi:hypothetical protein